ncbi:helix-turn-helix domain-containing protein [Bifidobacterium magnum]|nr:helix-turn-helix transcriptional regulator [Bifidobacterium magnum]
MDSETYSEAVAANIKAVMASQKLNRQTVCDLTGIPSTTFDRRLAHPENSPFNTNELDRIARALGVPITELVAVEDPTK